MLKHANHKLRHTKVRLGLFTAQHAMIWKEIKQLKRWAGEALGHQKRDWEILAGLSLSFCFHNPHLTNLDRIYSASRTSCSAATITSGWGNFSLRGGPFLIPVHREVSYENTRKPILKKMDHDMRYTICNKTDVKWLKKKKIFSWRKGSTWNKEMWECSRNLLTFACI